MKQKIKIGIGYDSHRFVDNRKLILGGVEIPYDRGLDGHSDADVLLHAICDALLGAAGLGDIGRHFPDNEIEFKDISSLKLLEKVNTMIIGANFEISNIDSVIIAEKPQLVSFIKNMESNISNTLNIPDESVSVKATTNEGMGFVGRGEGIAVIASVLLYKE
jgi:2-C-methyl-D-erythritol 2,4-cyclodiphosphate synthase